MPLVRFLAFSRPRDCELGFLLDLTNGRAMKHARSLGWVARRSSPSCVTASLQESAPLYPREPESPRERLVVVVSAV